MDLMPLEDFSSLSDSVILCCVRYCCRLWFCSRLLGTLVLSLQHLTAAGRLILREALVDRNHRATGVSPLWAAWPSAIRRALWETLRGASHANLGLGGESKALL